MVAVALAAVAALALEAPLAYCPQRHTTSKVYRGHLAVFGSLP